MHYQPIFHPPTTHQRVQQPPSGFVISKLQHVRPGTNFSRPFKFPSPGSEAFHNFTSPSRNYLLDLLNHSSTYIVEHARTEASNEKVDRCWRRWETYTNRLGIGHDPYLDTFPRHARTHLCRGFLEAVRRGEYSGGRGRRTRSDSNPSGNNDPQQLLGRSVRETASNLVENFRSALRPSPIHDVERSNVLDPNINKLFRAWESTDPRQQRSAAITPSHLRHLFLLATINESPTLLALSQLIAGAYFFAMRSCEYLRVPVRGRTKLLTVGNVCFSDATCRPIPHHHGSLSTRAYYVTITFDDQKSGKKGESRTHHRNDDNLLCPVKCWLRTVLRIRSYQHTTDTTTVNMIIPTSSARAPSKQIIVYFTQEVVNKYLRSACASKPDYHFGYNASDVGTHSIRSGAAMALFMADEHPYRIMTLGRWSSDAFLVYIRPQIQEWTTNLSKSMLKHEVYHTAMTDIPLRNNQRDPDDPMIRNDSRSVLGSNSARNSNGSFPAESQFSRFHLFG